MAKLMPLIAGILVAIFLVGVSALLSHAGGWDRLANRYRADRIVPGITHFMCRGMVGPVGYWFRLRVCDSGLRLSVPLFLRVGHPPLFIPWEEFHGVQEREFLAFRWLAAYVGHPAITRVCLPIWLRDRFPRNAWRSAEPVAGSDGG